MKHKVHFILLAASVLLATSCGTSYYSSLQFADDIYNKPTDESRLALIRAKEQQYIDEHAMVNSYFQVDSTTGRIYLRDGVSYSDLLRKFDNVNYNFTLSFGGWYDPWNPWFDPWYRPWYRPWHDPWYGPWGYDSWYRPWRYHPYSPGIIVINNPRSGGTRTGTSSYGFGHRTDSGLRNGAYGIGYSSGRYSGGSTRHRTSASSSHRSATGSYVGTTSSNNRRKYTTSSSPSSSYSSEGHRSTSRSTSGYSGGYSGGGRSGGGSYGSGGGRGHR